MPIDNNGVLLCARYAFSPNFYKFCGPDKNKTISDYLRADQADGGLDQILQDFEVLYPYLKLIAQANKIEDPFDKRVVEAYWGGNSLLENIKIKDFYHHLLGKQQLAKKYSKKALNLVLGNFPCQARVYHSFHVFNLFKRTGHLASNHTLNTMDNCRIGWGRIVKNQKSKIKNQKFGNITIEQYDVLPALKVRGFRLFLRENSVLYPNLAGALPFSCFHPRIKNSGFSRCEYNNKTVTILTQPLVYQNNKLALGKPVEKTLIDQFNLAKNLKIGDWVSFHWGFLCEKLTLVQVKNLNFYTNLSLSHL